MAQFKYVEMVCQLGDKEIDDTIPVEGIIVKSITNIEPDILFDCYINTFCDGDAKFFNMQNDEERREYFYEELGFPIVLQNPASCVYRFNDEIIGFALVLPYLEKNYHISCMCILPKYQNNGIGLAMLNRIKNIAIKNEYKTLSLGTETDMKAFHLYKNNGFIITQEHLVDI